MVLENFRRIDLQIDRANDYIIDTMLDAHAGDYNGRTLRVQITNNGLVTDTTGITLNFGFLRVDNLKRGVYPFTAVDLKQGIYEVVYPTDMLADGKGFADCQIAIIEGDSETNTRNFKVDIIRDIITNEAIVAENSPTVMEKALIDINNTINEIIIVEATLAEIMSNYKDLMTYFEDNLATKSDWQGIKTVVDKIDLDTSKVHEIHDRLFSHELIRRRVTFKDSNVKDAFKINGSGCLVAVRFIHARQSAWRDYYIQLMVDNVVILDLTVNGGSSTTSAYSSYLTIGPYNGFYDLSNSEAFGAEMVVNLSSTPQTLDAVKTSNLYLTCTLKSPIYFESSFSIRGSTSTPALSAIDIYYEVD